MMDFISFFKDLRLVLVSKLLLCLSASCMQCPRVDVFSKVRSDL